jgi:hypothetical protein
VTVQLTNNSVGPPATYTLQFDIPVIKCDAISVAPTVLMPVVVGAAYTQNLVAHGARDNFTWSDPTKNANTSLPNGLSWDADTHQLSGTVTDATQVGAFSLVVELAASDVIMDPLTVQLGITVQSAPVVASDMPPWEKIFIYSITASGLVMLALAAFAINRYRAAKNNNKTDDAVNAGKTNVEKKGDPRDLSKSIVQAENKTVPIVEQNIPYSQRLIDTVTQLQKDLKTNMDKNEAMIEKLLNYWEDHKRDNWDAEVTDKALADAGYETVGELIEGLGNLRKEVDAQQAMLSTAAKWSNQLTTKNTSDQDRVFENNKVEPNTDKL